MKPISSAQVGSNPGRSRLRNRQLVLQCVRDLKNAGRAQIARTTHLSTQAVSNIIGELQEEGLLTQTGRLNAGRGLPAIQYAIHFSAAAALGFEVRSDAVFVAVVDLGGNTLANERFALTDARPDKVATVVRNLRTSAMKKAGISADRLLGVTVVMPGPFGRVGLSDAGQSTLLGWEDVDAQQLFSDALNTKVVVEHDTVAAVFAERVSGAAIGLDSFAYIYFGTGIGLGVMSNGKVLRGAYGNAGELGHMIVERDGNRCACGNQGCLETYVSRFSLNKHLAKHQIDANVGEQLESLYNEGNEHILSWLDQACGPLAQTIGIVENLFDPQCIILGGAMPDGLIDHLIDRMQLPTGSIANRTERAVPRLVRGASGRMTATLGGAAIIINDVFVPRIEAA